MKSNYANKTGLGDAFPLRTGADGSSVRTLQTLLVEAGYSLPRYGIDGNFGNETMSAVMQFQRKYGLAVTGVVNSTTWQLLQSAANGTLLPPLVVTADKPAANNSPNKSNKLYWYLGLGAVGVSIISLVLAKKTDE